MAQVSLFLTGVFAVTWGLCFALRPAARQGGLGVFLAWLLPTVWAPTIIALSVALWSSGVAGVRKEIRRLSFRRGARHWSGRSAGDSRPFTASGAVPTMVILQLVTGAVGEELGWRGFLLPRSATDSVRCGRFGLRQSYGVSGTLPVSFFPALRTTNSFRRCSSSSSSPCSGFSWGLFSIEPEGPSWRRSWLIYHLTSRWVLEESAFPHA